MKTVIFTSKAAKDFDGLPQPARTAISEALNLYAISGEGDVKRLKGREGCRLGAYRVIFTEDSLTILAIYFGRRSTTTY